MKKSTFRVVTRGADGSLRIRDYDTKETLLRLHTQIGIDDSSTDLALRGLPVFRGLIGPMPENGTVVRYESPEVFETLTKEWALAKPHRRSRRQRGSSPLTSAAAPAPCSSAPASDVLMQSGADSNGLV